MNFETKNLIAALAKAYSEIGGVEKARHNTQQNYAYAGDVDFVNAVRPALISNGLTITPCDVRVVTTENYTTSKGTHMLRMVGVWNFRVAHTSGEAIIIAALGEGCDTGDKASYKAATGAFKYALRQAFVIATGDDAEAESPEPRSNPYNQVKATNDDL